MLSLIHHIAYTHHIVERRHTSTGTPLLSSSESLVFSSLIHQEFRPLGCQRSIGVERRGEQLFNLFKLGFSLGVIKYLRLTAQRAQEEYL